MNNFSLVNLKPRTKILWCLMTGLSLVAAGISVYQLFSISIQGFIVLAAAFAISSLITSQKINVFGTQVKVSAGTTLIFWSTLWLGAGSSALLAVSGLTEKIKSRENEKEYGIYQLCASVVSAFLAGNIFYLILRNGFSFVPAAVAENELNPFGLFAGILAAAVCYCFLNVLFEFIFCKLEDDLTAISRQKRNFAWNTVFCFLSIAAAIVLHLMFVCFGLAFGLFLAPMIVAAHFAYRIHERSLAQKTKEISEASRVHLATVEALATAIDARDQVGRGHVRRTQIYAIGIGKNLELSEDLINALRTGALLHDIGKLAVPDHILNKPGRLTPAEMEKTKIHASVGASILEKVGFSYPVVPTVKYHHETWDGNGYPEGLAGDEIPLTARILSVADAYDTLRGARPYRGAVLRDEARRYLLNGAGTQFDPKIVDVFLRNLRKFEAEVEFNGLSYSIENEESDSNLLHASETGVEQSYVEQIKRANREVFTLYELARVFSSSLNLQDTLSLFVQKIGEFIPFDTCAVYLLDESKENATVVYVKGKNSAALKNKSVKIGEGATGYVLKKRQAVQNINPGLDFSFSQLEFVQEYTSMASLPLITDEKLLGAVSLYSCEMESYEEEHLRLLETVSRIAADTIGKSIQHAETENHALTDPMTGLPNARSLQMQFEKEVARSKRSEADFQVLMLDLDGFKAVNDTFGHKAGDKLLKEVARVIKGQLRDYDFLARYAGDEFVAIIPETDADSVCDLCQRIEKAVKEFRLPISEGLFARVGVSLGSASYPQAGNTFDQMIIAADKQMYAVKSIRKNARNARQIQPSPPPVIPVIPVQAIPMQTLSEKDLIQDSIADNFIVEVDESHIVSSAIN